MNRGAVLSLLGAIGFVCTTGAVHTEGFAQSVVQPLPNPAQLRLSEALRTLAQDPRSVPALLEAGQASIGLGNVEAALGFFRRAEAIAPAAAGVKAGLAAVAVRQGQPLEALRLFAEAEAAGEPMRIHAAERGLAYDLVGDNVRAQHEYGVSLEMGSDPEVARRLALSQAIAGDQRASETTLLPLLQRQDLAAFRVRAFALAILGKSAEAVSIAETMLPERLSSRIAPYLRYMPRLTRAQQAAAANLGMFPRAAEIGRDDPAIVAYAAQPAAALPDRTAGSRLVPSGEPLGSREGARGVMPPLEPPEAEPEVEVSLVEAFSDFGQASPPAAAVAGAVDITAIQPRREAPRVAAPPAPPRPVHPSRQWVQLATGRDVAALEFDWRRIKRNAGGLLEKYRPHVAAWGRTNRLVAGPFGSAREAQEFVAKLKEKQLDSFRFTSAQGEEVRPLE